MLICTGDRDALQLVNDQVTVLYPRRGVSDLTRFTPEEVDEKYGLTPAQYPDFAALRGDPSDNLPSIPGVGEKTAAKWVREYGSLDALAEQVDTVKGKAGDALRENLASVLRNRRLTELVRDVPLDVTVDDLEREQWDRERGARAVRRPAVPGAARAAVRDRSPPPSRRPTRASTSASTASTSTRSSSGSTSTPATAAGSVSAFRGQWGRGTGALTGVALAAPTARRPISIPSS